MKPNEKFMWCRACKLMMMHKLKMTQIGLVWVCIGRKDNNWCGGVNLLTEEEENERCKGD